MEGGDGNDIYVTENVSDVIVENGTGKDVIYAINYITFNMNLTPNVEELRYSYIEGGLTQVTGNALDNVILQEGYRRLDGGQPPGNDILDGGAGDDLLGGGEGDDTYRVDSSLDQVFEDSRPTGGVDTVESTASSYSLSAMTTGRVENLIFTGTGAFTGSGNDFANVIRGGVAGDVLSGEGGKDSLVGLAGNDDLSGGNGNDELSGGIGEDELTGGLGSDSFVFTGLNEGADTIEDFSSTGSGNNDRLTFELADIGQLLGNKADGTGVLKAIHFQSSSAADATSANARFIYDIDTGSLRYDPDGTGNAASVLLAILTGAPTLDRSDIIIV